MSCLLFRICLVLTLLSSVILSARADELEDLTKRVAALEGNVKSLESVVNDNASQISKLSELVGDAFSKLNDQGAKQQSILDEISATDENGEIYLTFNSIMTKSATARQEVRKAVEQSIQTQGTLTIVNEMAAAQDIVVNHIQQRVQAGATLDITVPVGTVSTQLPGQDIVNWTIGVPNYKQSVSIKPRHTVARVTTNSPISTTSINQPIYFEAPVYYSNPGWGNFFIYR